MAGSGFWNPRKQMPFCLFFCGLPPSLLTCPATSAVVTEGIVLAPSSGEWVVPEPTSALGAERRLSCRCQEGRERRQEWEMDSALGMRWSRIQLPYRGLRLLLRLADWAERGNGRVVQLFWQRHNVFVTLAFFSVQWLLQSFDETAKIISFGFIAATSVEIGSIKSTRKLSPLLELLLTCK